MVQCCLCLLVLLALAPRCAASFDRSAENVSMVQLIADPAHYSGRHVRLIGYVNVGFEDNHVFLHRDDSLAGIMDDSLDLHLPPGVTPGKPAYARYQSCDGRYVLMEGTFSAAYNKAGRLWTRSIKDLTRFEAWGNDTRALSGRGITRAAPDATRRSPVVMEGLTPGGGNGSRR